MIISLLMYKVPMIISLLGQRTHKIEIFKTIRNLNPPFMHSIFSSRTLKYPSRDPKNLNHFRPNQVTLGSKSLKAIGPQIWNCLPNKATGPQIWNCLPNELKSADNLNSFKRMITRWDGPSCKCNVCKYNDIDIL